MSIAAMTDGLHAGVPESVYHARELGIASRSALDYVRRAPAIYRAWVDHKTDDDSTPALAFGRAFHAALLEPERFQAEYVVEPNFGDCRRRVNKETRDLWRSENAEKRLVEPKEWRSIYGMVAAVHAHPLARALLEGDNPRELTARWTNRSTSIVCKARADIHSPREGLIVDVKTCEDARPDAFAKSIARYAYHRQHAHYVDGFHTIGAGGTFLFVAVEKNPPHLVALYMLDEDGVMRARHTLAEDLDTLARCIELDRWNGYPEGIRVISLPTWA